MCNVSYGFSAGRMAFELSSYGWLGALDWISWNSGHSSALSFLSSRELSKRMIHKCEDRLMQTCSASVLCRCKSCWLRSVCPCDWLQPRTLNCQHAVTCQPSQFTHSYIDPSFTAR